MGGSFVLLPQVFSMDPCNDGVIRSNLGMYRIQLTGNEYLLNQEIGLHYQLHRGIAVHHHNALAENRALKVSIFIGGPPAHALAAVMPCPRGCRKLHLPGFGRAEFQIFLEQRVCSVHRCRFLHHRMGGSHRTKPEGPFSVITWGIIRIHMRFPISGWHRYGTGRVRFFRLP